MPKVFGQVDLEVLRGLFQPKSYDLSTSAQGCALGREQRSGSSEKGKGITEVDRCSPPDDSQPGTRSRSQRILDYNLTYARMLTLLRRYTQGKADTRLLPPA
ncbi:hypothetical protein SNOG_05185 [Parastagonospora nodorum SN15]|uniref:Uncharacterized protein n=1 Tax=Phaeosphaeria nodorum (strain SN15 / ATCC MYA-4574 / FGSC 10173) TaxID=321614 RepID=Q0USS9_PHANO|nr:hypothetical protein SNOG_05185 [Parastagonospora nodorum SN15]EAT87576.1 hypothetical protein SNOG_05185 [Parastagonospora nodorum SN15]